MVGGEISSQKKGVTKITLYNTPRKAVWVHTANENSALHNKVMRSWSEGKTETR